MLSGYEGAARVIDAFDELGIEFLLRANEAWMDDIRDVIAVQSDEAFG